MISTIWMLIIYLLAISIAKFLSYHSENPGLCIIHGLLIQFSYMSALFWLSALGHFYWNSFRKIKAIKRQNTSGINKKWGIFHPRYKWYALYSWGCPTIVTIVTIIIQYLPEDKTKQIWTPGIGFESCFFTRDLATIFYFHIINAPLLVSHDQTNHFLVVFF